MTTAWHRTTLLLANIIEFLKKTIYLVIELAIANWLWILIAAILLAALLIFRSYSLWSRGWLSSLVERRLARTKISRRKEWLASFRQLTLRDIWRAPRSFLFRQIQHFDEYLSSTPRQIKDVYLPSRTSFLLVCALLSLLFIAPHFFGFAPEVMESRFATLWDKEVTKKVFEGLIVVGVALIIFVAESIRESGNDERKRSLLRISHLWPFTVAITLFPLGYFVGENTPLTAFFVVAMCLFAIYAFGAILRNLLDADAQGQDLRALLKDRIHSLIMESARERIGNNILLQMLGPEKEIKIAYIPSRSWIGGNQKNYVFIDYPRPGWLSDINLDELRIIADLLEAHARKLGFEISETASTTTGARTRGASPGKAQNQKIETRKIYLLKKYREQLPRDSIFAASGRAILAIPKDLASDERLIQEIRRRTAQAFRLSDSNPSSFAFRREMQRTKDQLISAIRSISLGAVEDLSRTYLEVAEEFLETLHELGGGYSADQARNERGNIFEGWNEIRWLTSDIRELLAVTSESDNVDIIGNIVYLPSAIATRAVLAGDHLLFQEFTQFASYIYYLSTRKTKDSTARNFLSDRSWRHLKEICEFYVLPINLEIGGKTIDVSENKDFALFAFKVFQDILKAAYDADDVSTFNTVLNEMSRLFRNFNPKEHYRSTALLQILITQATDEAVRASIETELKNQIMREEAFDQIILGRQEAIFGLAAYLLDKCVADPSEPKSGKFYRAIDGFLPNDLTNLTKVFDRVKSSRFSSYFDWTRWDSILDGQARFVDTDTKPNRLYWVRALEILGRMDSAAISSFKLPPNDFARSLLSQTGEQGIPEIVAPLFAVKSENAILGENARERVEPFREILRRSMKDADRREEDDLITASLDQSKLESFYDAVVSTRNEYARVRPLLNVLGSMIENPDSTPRKDILSWGFNQLDEKGAFIANSRISYPAWGESYGRGLAQSEDKIAFESMFDHASTKVFSTSAEIFTTIRKSIARHKIKDPVILHSLLTFFDHAGLEQGSGFISRYRNDCPATPVSDLPGFAGVLKNKGRDIPVISIFVDQKDLKGRILIADFKRLARWYQFPAIDDTSDESFLHDLLLIQVTDLNTDETLRKKILEDAPEYLEHKEDKDRYLRTRVVVKVFEKFKLDILDPTAGIAITVQTEDL